jgi:hypothetical protein
MEAVKLRIESPSERVSHNDAQREECTRVLSFLVDAKLRPFAPKEILSGSSVTRGWLVMCNCWA